MLWALVSHYWSPLTKKEFWHGVDYRDLGKLIAFIPEDARKAALEEKRGAFEIF